MMGPWGSLPCALRNLHRWPWEGERSRVDLEEAAGRLEVAPGEEQQSPVGQAGGTVRVASPAGLDFTGPGRFGRCAVLPSDAEQPEDDDKSEWHAQQP